MRKKLLVVLLVATLCVAAASAQFGGDRLRPDELPKRFASLLPAAAASCAAPKDLHADRYRLQPGPPDVAQPHNMPARYRAQFSHWRNVTATNTYGNTSGWLSGINADLNASEWLSARRRSLASTDETALAGMPDYEQARVKSQYASVELADGANMNAHGRHRRNSRQRGRSSKRSMNNLEQDSLSDDEGLNSEVAVLNKINAANVLTLRSIQDSNKLLASLLEQQTIARQAAARNDDQRHQRRHQPAGQTEP